MTDAGAAELAVWGQSPVRSSRQLKDDFYLKLATLATVLNQPAQLAELIWRQREVYLLHLRELEHALAEAEAARKESDREREHYLKRFYSVSEELPTHYDVTVNTDVLLPEVAVATIVAAAGA